MPLDQLQTRNIRRNKREMYHKLSQPCMDCTYPWHPLVMTLDHRDRSMKQHTLSKILTVDPKYFLQELGKCDSVCRNCHQIREYLRDLGVIKISERKRGRYRYYEQLVPYLRRGALLRKDAYDFVPIIV